MHLRPTLALLALWASTVLSFNTLDGAWASQRDGKALKLSKKDVETPNPIKHIHPKNNLLILGLGRVGRCVAQQAAPYFQTVFGTTTTGPPKVVPNQEDPQNLNRIAVTDILSPAGSIVQKQLKNCTHVLVTIPGTAIELVSSCNNNNSDSGTRTSVLADDFYNALTKELVAGAVRQSVWVGVLSTTAVYGNHHGKWVNEASDCRVNSSDLKAMKWLQYETDWKERVSREETGSASLRLFRCAGIYGNTRSALHTVFARGGSDQPSANDTSVASGVTNRIHELDLSRAVVASMLNTANRSSLSPFEVYNLADDLPESRGRVMEYARQLFDDVSISLPNKEKRLFKGESTRSRRRRADSKLIDNTKMKSHLLEGSNLLFPTYVEGLESIYGDPGVPWAKELKKHAEVVKKG